MADDMVAILVPITAITCGIGIGVVAILAAHRQRMQRAELRHRERIAAIEKGLELPPDPPDSDPNSRRRPRHLLRGLVLLFVGIALTIAMRETAGGSTYLYGLVVAAVGLANLIYYALEGRKESAQALSAPPPEPPIR